MTITTQARPTTPYERLGGAVPLRRIVDRFYDLMESDPAYRQLRSMHAADLAPMRDSLAGFLAGWAGGPRDWFDANPGRCMGSVHARFAISADTAGQWIDAMQRAINEVLGESDAELARAMTDHLGRMARSMVRSSE